MQHWCSWVSSPWDGVAGTLKSGCGVEGGSAWQFRSAGSSRPKTPFCAEILMAAAMLWPGLQQPFVGIAASWCLCSFCQLETCNRTALRVYFHYSVFVLVHVFHKERGLDSECSDCVGESAAHHWGSNKVSGSLKNFQVLSFLNQRDWSLEIFILMHSREYLRSFPRYSSVWLTYLLLTQKKAYINLCMQ